MLFTWTIPYSTIYQNLNYFRQSKFKMKIFIQNYCLKNYKKGSKYYIQNYAFKNVLIWENPY